MIGVVPEGQITLIILLTTNFQVSKSDLIDFYINPENRCLRLTVERILKEKLDTVEGFPKILEPQK